MYPLALKMDDISVVPISKIVKAIKADKLWDLGITGKGVKVAVLDTGVDDTHPMLRGKVKHAESLIEGESYIDEHSHGTWCCSAIAGRKVTALGEELYGVAPDVELIVIKVLSNEGVGSMSGVIRGMERAIELGADIVSMSLGSLFGSNLTPDSKALNELSTKYNTIFVCAAGNSFGVFTIGSPCSAIMSVGVGAVAYELPRHNAPATYSSKGPTVDGVIKPNIATYGGNVIMPGKAEVLLSAGADGSYVAMAGTCLAPDTLIYTPDGPIELKNIEIGDLVYTNNGVGKVTGVMDKGVKQLYELKTSSHTIYATDNHPFLIKRGNTLIWCPLKDIKKGDVIVQSRNIESNVVAELQQIITKDIIKWIGFFAGDGWISRRRRNYMICIAKGNTSQEYIDFAKKVLGLDFKQYEKWYYTYSKRMALILSILGLGEYHNNLKRLSWVFNLPKEYQKQFLKGFVDADGYRRIGVNKIDIEIASHDFARFLVALCDYCGYAHSNIRKRDRTHRLPSTERISQWTTYSFTIYPTKLKDGHTLLYNAEKYIDLDRFRLRKVTSIKEIGEDRVYDLEVLGHGNFIANGFLVHNSMATPIVSGVLALMLSAGLQKDRFLIEELLARTGGFFINTITGWGMIDAYKMYNVYLDMANQSYQQLQLQIPISSLSYASYILTQPAFQLLHNFMPERRDTIRIRDFTYRLKR